MIDLKSDEGHILVLVSERIREDEWIDLKSRLEREVSTGARPRILCVLSEFWGFDSEALWDDFRYWLEYVGNSLRVAVLAEPRWIDLVATPGFRASPGLDLKGFALGREAEARSWLAGGRAPAGASTPVR